MEGKETVYVIGHKNPDTDSVCSAICYARLKEKITGQHYVAKRAGHLNEETQYVMDKLGDTAAGIYEGCQTTGTGYPDSKNTGCF